MSISALQVRDVVVGITLVDGDVVLLSSLVTRERETVTDLVMEVNMTATLAARETSCVGVTTVESLGLIFMRKMTAVRRLLFH